MLQMLLLAFLCSNWLFLTAGDYTFGDARNRFQKTLLVVKHNFKSNPGPVLLHIRMWSKVFTNQLIFINWNDAEIANFTTNHLDVNGSISLVSKLEPHYPGFIAYEVVTLAMKSHPNYEGYLFAHDDMAMNITALIGLDLQSCWLSEWFSLNVCKNLDPLWNVTKNGWWWDSDYGTRAIDKMLANDNNTVIAREMKEVLGSNHHWCGEQSDFFYIPQTIRDVYIRVMGPFADAGIFLEIAVPTFIRVYVPPEKYIKVPLCTMFNGHIRLNNSHIFEYMEAHCGDKYPLYHPIKLSFKPNVAGMRKKMALLED